MPTSTVGVDIGGTKIAAARFDDDFQMLDRATLPTPRVATELADAAIAAVRKVWDRDVIAVGAGVAGLVRWPEGVLTWVPHVEGGQVDLRTLLGEDLAVPVVVDHDANVAALAEFELGAARGYDHGILVTVGTGIGGGFVVDGEIWRGRSFAGEIGHMQVHVEGAGCPCGNRGCWETLASGTALARLAQTEVEAHPEGAIARLAGGDEPRGEHVTEAARQGDGAAQALLEEVAGWLGVGLANLVAAFDPEVIIVGGGLGSVVDEFLVPARRVARRRLYAAEYRPTTPILPSEFGADAGLVGAGLSAWREVSLRFRIRERTRRLAERSGLAGERTSERRSRSTVRSSGTSASRRRTSSDRSSGASASRRRSSSDRRSAGKSTSKRRAATDPRGARDGAAGKSRGSSTGRQPGSGGRSRGSRSGK